MDYVRTVPEYWWCEDPKVDPWMWREIIARSGEIAYGKFFDKKAGFISIDWLPIFANYRRDGYDFEFTCVIVISESVLIKRDRSMDGMSQNIQLLKTFGDMK